MLVRCRGDDHVPSANVQRQAGENSARVVILEPRPKRENPAQCASLALPLPGLPGVNLPCKLPNGI